MATVADGESLRAFAPGPLPPHPPVEITGALGDQLNRAHVALGRLDGVSATLPDSRLFLYSYVRKEAVVSSQIEGTQSSLSDLMLFELEGSPGVPFDDVIEVSNYVAALEHGLARIRSGLPLSNRLIREVHAKLLASGRGRNSSPGEFRRSQNWIGGSRPSNTSFLPAPPQLVEPAMAELERFLHDEPERTPTLLKAALAHVQFETIHPFLDGNGRIGRLLIPMILCIEGMLREPLLYLSLYLKQNRARYYDLLNRVRTEGEWEEWVGFFAAGVEETAHGAITTAQRMNDMAQAHRLAIQEVGRVSGSAFQVHHALLARPINTIARLALETKLSVPAVTSAILALSKIGIVREITGRRRGRVYAYGPYLDLLQQGTEPL